MNQICLRKFILLILLLVCLKFELFGQKPLSFKAIEAIKTTSPAVWDKNGDTLYYTSSNGLWLYSIKKGVQKELTIKDSLSGEPRISRDGKSLGVQCGSHDVCIVNLTDYSIEKKTSGEMDSRWDIHGRL